MLIALAAAGVTLAVALGVIGIPVIGACSTDPRGVVTCLRDMADRKFDLPGTIPGKSAESVPVPMTEHAEPNVVVDLPPPAAPPELQATETETLPAGVLEQPVVAVVPEGREPVAAPTPAVASPAEAARAETPTAPPPAAVELAAAPDAPVIPPAGPTPDTPTDTALTWSAPPLADLAPPPLAPIADETTQQAAATPTDPLPAVAPESTSEPEPEPVAAPRTVVPKAETAVAPTADPLPFATDPTLKPAPAADDAMTFDPAPVGTVPPAPAIDVANAEPAAAQAPPPAVAAPLVLAPTIDAIELEGAASYVSGSGPAGALMRLYADGELIGESPVEEGRWLVEGSNLLDSPRSELRVEAIEPETGKLLGSAAITVEIELPDGGAPPDERPAKPPEFGGGVAPADIASPAPEALAELPEIAAQPPAPILTSEPEETAANHEPLPLAEPEPQAIAAEPEFELQELPAKLTEPPAEAALGEPDPLILPEPLPELAAVTPQGESASVEILGSPELEPTILPHIGAIDHEPATITLDPPDAPALVADLEVPAPKPAGRPVTILRLLPFGDPDSGRYNVGKAIIRHGDTLWSIARRYYGHGIHYRTIFHANRDQIRRPSRIFPGQIFDLPLVTDD